MSMLSRISLSFFVVAGGRCLYFSDFEVEDGEEWKSDEVEELKKQSH